MQEIYLDDYHLHSLNTAGLPTKVNRGLEGLEAPVQRLDSYNNPGADGQTIANVLHGGRLITIEGRIRSDTEAEYRANRAAFHQLVGANRSSSGQYNPRVLKLTDANSNEYRVSCVVRSLKNPDEFPTTSAWQLQLVATDFRLYSEALAVSVITLPVSGGITLPVTLPATFGASFGGAMTATNIGTIPTPPVVNFYGPMASPRLTNTTTGQQIGLNLTLVSGDVVTVDMAARTIIQGTNTNRMSAKTAESKFWMLEPGVNDLRLIATSFDSGYATITYRSAFSGI